MIPRDILNLAPTKNDDKADIVPSLDLKGTLAVSHRRGVQTLYLERFLLYHKERRIRTDTNSRRFRIIRLSIYEDNENMTTQHVGITDSALTQ